MSRIISTHEVDDVTVTRVTNSNVGAPRYVVHYLAFPLPGATYEDTLAFLKKAKGVPTVKKFHNRLYGGGIVFESYRGPEDVRDLIAACQDS